MLRTQIQLTEQQVAALKARAATEGVSLAELIRRCIDQMLASSVGPEPTERTRRAASIAGCFRSGAGDLSINHDKYLAEAFDK
ncbi:MAG: ribbon-helix-helix protein, CopG family [Peptococcaceae bacterium]|nr:MAG: ribbon-helix-helix protein, CopG family [Peptococcaceae bacterium]